MVRLEMYLGCILTAELKDVLMNGRLDVREIE